MFSRKSIFIAALSFMVFSAPVFFANEALSAGKQYDLAVGSLRGTMGRLGAGLANVINKNNKDSRSDRGKRGRLRQVHARAISFL